MWDTDGGKDPTMRVLTMMKRAKGCQNVSGVTSCTTCNAVRAQMIKYSLFKYDRVHNLNCWMQDASLKLLGLCRVMLKGKESHLTSSTQKISSGLYCNFGQSCPLNSLSLLFSPFENTPNMQNHERFFTPLES